MIIMSEIVYWIDNAVPITEVSASEFPRIKLFWGKSEIPQL